MTEAANKKLLIDLAACDSCVADGTGCEVCEGIFSLREKATFELICRRCENASCVVACPFDAITKTNDGIIKRHNLRCVSCKNCAIACPFGTIYSEMLPFYEVSCADCLEYVADTQDQEPGCVARCARGALEYRTVDPQEPGVHLVDEFLAARARKWSMAESSLEDSSLEEGA